ncbi:hypothetical protein DFH94DRAFT_698337 [Russula ochroleuca]|jgi:hypothetical protein|uniref:Uncharacterized protein n=1 Tax=Russula ochroleuca TaxID=152965 RepID=A0A9P5MNX7_9AGAM|nr:hypothetical protein DFH94DRAFT_698337 [Russula ochroleuca]
MVFGLSKSSSRPWTPNSFPGGKSLPSPMLFGPVFPVTGSPYVGVPPPAMALSPMVVPMQMPSPIQTIPITVQHPSPGLQVVPVQFTPSPSFAVLQPPPPPPPPPPQMYVPSPVVPSPPQVFQVIGDGHHVTSGPVGMLVSASPRHQPQQQQGSPGNVTVNLHVKTPERRSRELRDRSPSPSHWQQLQQHQRQQHQQWQQMQEQQQELWRQEQEQRLWQWQQAQQQQQRQWQHEQEQRRLVLDTNVTVPVPISFRGTLSPAR